MTFQPTIPNRMEQGRVLVVDDEATVRKPLRICLSQAGYDVLEAVDGCEAMTVMNSGDNALMVDAILCDIRMPKLNGPDTIDYFRAQYPSIPVIVLTGFPDTESAVKMMKLGVKDYLLKPVTKHNLLGALRRAVEGRTLFKDQFAA